MKHSLPGCLAALLALAGCSTRSLSDYTTANVEAALTATDTGGTTTVTMTLTDPSAPLTFLQLTSDDSLLATVGTAAQTLSETSTLGFVSYGTAFLVDQADITVGLTRKKDAGAPHSLVTLPPVFTLTPPTGATQSRAQALTVAWSPVSAEAMSISITGDCLQLYTTDIPGGTTQVSVPAGSVQKRTPSGSSTIPDTCTATASVTRTRPGTLDPAFHGGSANGLQVRTFTFTTAP